MTLHGSNPLDHSLSRRPTGRRLARREVAPPSVIGTQRASGAERYAGCIAGAR